MDQYALFPLKSLISGANDETHPSDNFLEAPKPATSTETIVGIQGMTIFMGAIIALLRLCCQV